MQIIILTTSRIISGGTRQALYQASGFQKRGYAVHFVCYPNSATEALAKEMGLDCTGLPEKIWQAEKVLRSLMRPGEPVVLHAFHNKGVKWAAYLGTWWRILGLPVACVAHRGVTSRPGNPLPYLLPGIRAYLVNSAACAKTLPLLWRKKRCFVVNNAIPPERVTPARSRAEMLKALNIPSWHMVIGNVCNDNPAKGAGRLLRAFADSRARNERAFPAITRCATLVIVGVTPEKWLPLCDELGISNDVRLVPKTDHVADYMQCMDVFVFPSSFIESQPNVILEAMNMGLPVLAGDVGGVSGLVPQACLFDPEKEKKISDKILEFMENEEMMQAFGKVNRIQGARFSLEHRLAVLDEHYRQVLGEFSLAQQPVIN